MAIAKNLHKFSVMESLNAKVALNWEEAARGQIHTGDGETGTAMEHVFALPVPPKKSTHTVVYLYSTLVCSIGFYDNASQNNGNNSLRMQAQEVVKFFIRSGATHLNIKSLAVAAANRYAYLIAG